MAWNWLSPPGSEMSSIQSYGETRLARISNGSWIQDCTKRSNTVLSQLKLPYDRVCGVQFRPRACVSAMRICKKNTKAARRFWAWRNHKISTWCCPHLASGSLMRRGCAVQSIDGNCGNNSSRRFLNSLVQDPMRARLARFRSLQRRCSVALKKKRTDSMKRWKGSRRPLK